MRFTVAEDGLRHWRIGEATGDMVQAACGVQGTEVIEDKAVQLLATITCLECSQFTLPGALIQALLEVL